MKFNQVDIAVVYAIGLFILALGIGNMYTGEIGAIVFGGGTVILAAMLWISNAFRSHD